MKTVDIPINFILQHIESDTFAHRIISSSLRTTLGIRRLELTIYLPYCDYPPTSGNVILFSPTQIVLVKDVYKEVRLSIINSNLEIERIDDPLNICISGKLLNNEDVLLRDFQLNSLKVLAKDNKSLSVLVE